MDRLDELIRQGLLILRGMWEWRWAGLVVAWLVAAVATVMILRIPNQYEASARIYVDTQSVLKPLMSGLAVHPNIDWQLQMLSRTLISRPNVEKLIRMADLDHTVQTAKQRDDLVESLMRKLQIRGTDRDNLYTLYYWAEDPQRAHRVVQSLTSMFVEMSMGDKRKDADSARKFIEEQIKAYEAKLVEAENRLKAFRLRNLGLELGGDSFGRVSAASAALNQARLSLREAENARDAFKRQIEGEEPVFLGGFAAESPAVAQAVAANSEIDQRIDGLKRGLDTLLLRYTDHHPDVIGTRRLIKDLEEQKREMLAEAKAKAKAAAAAPGKPDAPARNVAQNPVYQQLKLSLADSEANVASLRSRVAEYEARYNQVRSNLVMRPDIEIEYTQLNRDYDVHKRNYETLVSRREQAIISTQMEATAAMADFRLVEPPRVKPEPVAPNRLRLFHLAFLGALGAGLLAALAASRIRPTFFDPRSLRDVTGVPVLGPVSMIVSEPQKRRERRGKLAFAAGTAALAGSYAAGIVALSFYATRLL